MTTAAELYTLEAMLLRWSDSHNGRTVTLLLPDDGGEHPFRGLRCGPANGERLAISVARIADDETQSPLKEDTAQPCPSNEAAPQTGGARRPFASLPLPQQAALLCNDPVFRAFLNEEYNYNCENENDAAEALRERCQVKSRSELKPNTPAGKAFVDHREQFQAWRLVSA